MVTYLDIYAFTQEAKQAVATNDARFAARKRNAQTSIFARVKSIVAHIR